MRVFVTAILLSALGCAAHAGELYRYVDKDGRVTYSDMPPPKNAKQIERKAVNEAAPEVALPFATREAAKKFPVTLYANDCGDPCTAARALLEKRGVPYMTKDPSVSEPDAVALTKLVGAMEVPVMVVGKLKPVKGFGTESWNAALDEAGYPKTNPAVKPAQARRKDAAARAPAAATAAGRPATQPAGNTTTPAKSETPASANR